MFQFFSTINISERKTLISKKTQKQTFHARSNFAIDIFDLYITA